MSGSSHACAITIDDSDDDSDDKGEKTNKIDEDDSKKRRASELPETGDDEDEPELLFSSPQGGCIKLFATNDDLRLRKRHSKDQNHWCFTQCWTLREMLGMNAAARIEWLFVANYMIDFAFLMDLVPELVSIPKVVALFGIKPDDNSAMDSWKKCCDGVEFVHRNPSMPRLSSSNPLPVQINWGCHHTKLFFVGFGDNIRVIIHTANMLYGDVHLKAQGAFIQDFPYKAKDEPQAPCDFEEELISYFQSYHYDKRNKWDPSSSRTITLAEQLRKYDYSSAKVVLIPSTPGHHTVRRVARMLGYQKLSRAVKAHAKEEGQDSQESGPIVCQFSSIGSLSSKYLQKLLTYWDVRYIGAKGKSPPLEGNLEIVYPAVSDVTNSIEGVAGGGSVPGRRTNVSKPFLKPLFRKWASGSTGLEKPQNVPHIKTYFQRSDDDESMGWFVLSSHNLSKAAWGEEQYGQRGESFKIFHWELGVFLSPKLLGAKRLVPWPARKDGDVAIPLPYRLCPERYSQDDEPWTID